MSCVLNVRMLCSWCYSAAYTDTVFRLLGTLKGFRKGMLFVSYTEWLALNERQKRIHPIWWICNTNYEENLIKFAPCLCGYKTNNVPVFHRLGVASCGPKRSKSVSERAPIVTNGYSAGTAVLSTG